MATVVWEGGAPPVAQVDTFTVGGTVEADDIFKITIGNSVVSVVAGSTVLNTVASTIATAVTAAIAGGLFPEFTGLTCAYVAATATLTLTGVAGTPFTATATTTETGGGAADLQTFVKTATTACSGPNYWSNATNWSTGAVPIAADDVVIENTAVSILYGLDQSAVVLTSLRIEKSFTGDIGLPTRNANGYAEYQEEYLKISATTGTIGRGEGDGSGRIKINLGSVQSANTVHSTGTSDDEAEGVEAVLLKGTHASNTLTVLGGTVGVAVFGGETATIATLKVTAGSVRCGSGVTLTTVRQSGGGTVEIASACTTLTQDPEGGILRVLGAGAVTTVNAYGPNLDYQGSGAITTLNVTGTISFEGNIVARTVTNTNLYADSTLRDRSNSVTFTNPIATPGTTIDNVNLLVGVGRTYAVA